MNLSLWDWIVEWLNCWMYFYSSVFLFYIHLSVLAIWCSCCCLPVSVLLFTINFTKFVLVPTIVYRNNDMVEGALRGLIVVNVRMEVQNILSYDLWRHDIALPLGVKRQFSKSTTAWFLTLNKHAQTTYIKNSVGWKDFRIPYLLILPKCTYTCNVSIHELTVFYV